MNSLPRATATAHGAVLPGRRLATLLGAVLASAMAACGGGDAPPESTLADAADRATAAAVADPTPPLLDDEGQPMPGTLGRMASPAQLAQLEIGREQDVVRVWVDALGLERVQRAGVVTAHGPAAADAVEPGAMLFVSAEQAYRAAAVVERLRAQGRVQVWQVQL